MGLSLCGVLIFNGLFMLVSPRAWFALPEWAGFRGKLSAEKYSRGWGALQVRITGAMLLGLLLWMACTAVFR
jgi:hypothetical protein